MPLVRIKRMGNQFLSCGIMLRPPAKLIDKPNIKRLCPKLVPGQVVELPEDHNALNQDCIEIVRKVQDDEILRPWVFDNPEDALMANPSKSRLSHDDIVSGLAMAEGAVANADEHREKARAKKLKKAERETEFDEDEDGEPDIDPNENLKRSGNRQRAEVYEDAKPVARSRPAPAPEPEVPAAEAKVGRRTRNRG